MAASINHSAKHPACRTGRRHQSVTHLCEAAKAGYLLSFDVPELRQRSRWTELPKPARKKARWKFSDMLDEYEKAGHADFSSADNTPRHTSSLYLFFN